MAYSERDFQTEFNRWLKIIFRRTAAFELKISRTGSLPFSSLAQHQSQALFHAKHGILPFKIPDVGFQNPFDMFILAEVPAFVVVAFHVKSPHFYMIDIDIWLKEEQISDRKSLTEERAGEIGQKYDLSGSMPYAQPPVPQMASVG